MTQEPSIYTPEWIEKEAEIFLAWMQKPDSVFFKSFCAERKYSAQRLTEFEKKSARFAEVMQLAREWQEQKIVSLGLWGKLNAGMSKFVLINHHDYKELPNTIIQHVPQMDALDGKSKDLVDEQE